MLNIKLNLNLIPLSQARQHQQQLSDFIKLKPQLAYDPKIGTDYRLFFEYCWTNFEYACIRANLAKGSFYVEPKLDGVRGQFVIKRNAADSTRLIANCFSRANRKLLSVPHMCDELANSKPLAYYFSRLEKQGWDIKAIVVDTELFMYNTKEPSGYEQFRIINGVTNRRTSDSDTAKLKAYIFQCYALDKNDNVLFTIEPTSLEHFVWDSLGVKPETNWVIAPHYLVSSASQLATIAEQLRNHHLEGLVAKSPDWRHVDGRTKNWLKLKFKRVGTFKLEDVISGEGKCLGNAGAILIRDSLGQTSLVGTGFTDQDRLELSSLDLSKPHYVEIEYMTKTGDSLREAVYKGLRYDIDGMESISLDNFMQR